MSDNRTPNEDRRVDEPGSLVSGPATRQLTTAQKLGIAGLVLVVFMTFIFIGHSSRVKEASKKQETQITPNNSMFRAAPIVLPPLPPPEMAQLPLPALPAARTQNGHEATPEESPIFAFSGSSGGSGGGTINPETPSLTIAGPSTAANQQPVQPQSTQVSPLAARLTPTLLQSTRATFLPHPDMLVTEGTIIACTMQTAINTELAGYAKCVLPEDVRGTTGNVVLLDRGTVVTGEIESGLLQGQNRVFVLWDRAETPDHAVITLASPGTDELGRAGVTGAVDNHFWQRFGGAILLSVIQGVLQAGTALAANTSSGSGSGSGNYFNSFQTNGTQIADTALKASIDIPPTLTKNQGESIAIFVAHDLDFSDIYKLRLKGADDGE